MEIFHAYCDEFNLLSREVENKVSTAENISQITDAEKKLQEAQDNLKQMEIEVAGMRGADKKLSTDKLNTYRDNFRKLKSTVADKRFMIENKDLMGTKSGEDRIRMKKANDKLMDSSDQLQRALATVAEIEETGTMITTELKSNTERIAASKEKVKNFFGFVRDNEFDKYDTLG